MDELPPGDEVGKNASAEGLLWGPADQLQSRNGIPRRKAPSFGENRARSIASPTGRGHNLPIMQGRDTLNTLPLEETIRKPSRWRTQRASNGEPGVVLKFAHKACIIGIHASRMGRDYLYHRLSKSESPFRLTTRAPHDGL